MTCTYFSCIASKSSGYNWIETRRWAFKIQKNIPYTLHIKIYEEKTFMFGESFVIGHRCSLWFLVSLTHRVINNY